MNRGADGPLPGAPGPEVILIQGGSNQCHYKGHKIAARGQMQNTYASTTECILQNLTMTVGNPSFANAPWRAFTWTCALRQENNSQPWGNLQDAAQESLELAEATRPQATMDEARPQYAGRRQSLRQHVVEPLPIEGIPLPVCGNPRRRIPAGSH